MSGRRRHAGRRLAVPRHWPARPQGRGGHEQILLVPAILAFLERIVLLSSHGEKVIQLEENNQNVCVSLASTYHKLN